MSEPFPTSEATPASAPRRRWPYILFLALLPVFAGIALLVYRNIAGDRELQAALAETDRLDPRWRLEDLEADRAVVPDDKNSGPTVLAAKQLMPKDWPFWWSPLPMFNAQNQADAAQKTERQLLDESFGILEPQRQLNEEQVTALREEMKRAAAALVEARKLADLTEGRYPINYSLDFISTPLTHIHNARAIGVLLGFDVMSRAQDKDADGALASCRAILNAGRSIGDEPMFISQIVRIALRGIAVNRVQRVLAQTEPSAEALQQLQQLLEREEAVPLLLIAARGERAGQDRLLEAELAGLIPAPGPSPTLYERLFEQADGPSKADRVAMLRCQNRYVEIAKLAPEKRQAAFQQLQATSQDQPVFVRQLVQNLPKLAGSPQRSDAQLRCAIVAVAAERYRCVQGQWPATLDALKAADFLQAIPTDPYDGQPLRWRREVSGVIVYAVGAKGQYDGGKMDRQTEPRVLEVDFRLWDVAKRRQLPRLDTVLAGQAQPADDAERLTFARYCLRPVKKHYAASCRFYSEAFANDPALAEDMEQQHRYHAACAAALAGCGQGNDAGALDDKERARLRKQAVAWLRADLVYWTNLAEFFGPSRPESWEATLHDWQEDADLTGIRDKDALAKLPADEQEACRKLWADAAELFKKAGDAK